MGTTSHSSKRQKDPTIIKSMYSSTLNVKWPTDPKNFDDHLNSNVNLFRCMFAYLFENEFLLEKLQDDGS